MKSLYCALVLVACSSTLAAADDCSKCQQCGCAAQCQKTCRLICETKKVPKVTYTCECEEFCVPGPSTRCVDCDECGHKKYTYTPTCAQVRTRKKAVKHETMEEKSSYRWVVEDVCGACAGQCTAEKSAEKAKRPSEHSDSDVKQVNYETATREAEKRTMPKDMPKDTTTAADAGLTSQLRRALTPVFTWK